MERTLAEARRAGLQVLLFPIVRLEYALTPQEWRGALRPRDPERWWQSYRVMLLELARVARRHRAAALCVGSELSTMDQDPAPWRPLLKQVRAIFAGQLVYSANWDAYQRAAIWPLVDLAGVSAYFQLTGGEPDPTLERLVHAWREQRVAITRWQVRVGKALVFTELGYHSQQGTNAQPWDESADRAVNEAEQARCYRAFMRAWQGAPHLAGVYFWTWFGYGGPSSREYTPRGKAAARELCAYFGSPETCPTSFGLSPGEPAVSPQR